MTTTRSTVQNSAATPTNTWSTVHFGQLVENHDGRRVPLKSEDRLRRSGPYPYYGASGIIDQIDDFLFDGEFLLIAEDGANLVARATPIAFRASGRFWVNNHAHVVRPKDGVLLDYLIHWFAQADISRYVTGSAQPKLSQAKLNEIPVPLPPLAEQQRIAGRLREQLAEVAKARTAVQAQLAAAQALPAAVLSAIFQSPVADAWHTELLGDVTHIGAGVTLGRDLRGRETRLVPYLRVANVKDSWLDLSDVNEVEATEREIEDCQLRYGDLLLTEGGDRDKLGRGMFWQDQLPECIHQNHIFRVRFDLTKFDPAFVSLQVSSKYGKAFFLAHAKQTTGIATINRGVLTRFPLRAPPLAEQRTIAARLAAELAEVTRLRESLSGKLEALDRLPAALLAQAFQGDQ